MVLVAAVAAGVLVNTSGLLQSQAQDTGADAQAQVSNQIDVVSAIGENSTADEDINKITLVVKKSPGSDPIDLSQASIQYTSDSDSLTLTQGSGFSIADGPTVLDQNSDRAEVEIVLDTNNGTPAPLEEGAEAQLKLVDQSGASTVYGVNVPDVLTGTYVEV
jgi:archaellin